jgi:hypothetical protein
MGLALISILGRDGPPSTEPDSSAAPLSWALRELGSLDCHSTMDADTPVPVPVPDLSGGRGRSPVPVPALSGIGDSAPSPSPIC